MKVYVLKIGYNPNTDEVEYIKEYIEGAKATLEVDGKEIELDDEIGDLIVSDEMGLAQSSKPLTGFMFHYEIVQSK